MRSPEVRRIARGWGAACILVLPTLLLGSCMTAPGFSGALAPATAATSTADFFAVVEATQATAGGGWSVQDDTIGRGCTLPGGGRGLTFSALRISDPVPAGAGEVTEAVSGVWEDFGFSVDAQSIGPVEQLIGRAPGGEVLIFRVSARAMTLQGESECQPSE